MKALYDFGLGFGWAGIILFLLGAVLIFTHEAIRCWRFP